MVPSAATFLLAGVLLAAVDPTELVRRLGAPRYADREAASRELQGLGRDALPALQAASKDNDPEVRTRVARLLATLERDWCATPTLIPLNFEDRTIDEVVKAIDGRNGLRLALLVPEKDPKRQQKINLRTTKPVEFWEAVDRLCRVAELRCVPGNQIANTRDDAPITRLMRRGPGEKESPSVHSGPFRISLIDLNLEGPSTLGRVENRGHGARLDAELLVEPEPRMNVSPGDSITWEEAVDELGQSLIPPGAHRRRHTDLADDFGYFAIASKPREPRLQIHAPLVRPERPGRTIKTLRGALSVWLSPRESKPFLIALDGAVGKTFRDARVAITVHSITANPIKAGFSMFDFDLTIQGQVAGAVFPEFGFRGF